LNFSTFNALAQWHPSRGPPADFKWPTELAKFVQYNARQILVIAFEFTGAARSFMVTSCVTCGVKKGWTALH